MSADKSLNEQAKDILRGNDQGGYTIPTKNVYPYQWNWDSAFVALGFSTFDIERAWAEIETLVKGQWKDGFLPHIIFWKDDPGYFPGPDVWSTGKTPKTSGITQPPVAATALRRIWDNSDQKAYLDRVNALFPKLLAWHRWFSQYRDPLDNGTVLTSHPWETGRDNSPEWDAPSQTIDISKVEPYQRRDTSHLDQSMRPLKIDYDRYLATLQFGRDTGWDHQTIADKGPFRMVDVGMTMILLRANRDLLALAQQLGHEEAVHWIEAQIKKTEAGISYLWNDNINAFCSRDLKTGKSSGQVTSASFLSFYAGVGSDTQKAYMTKHLERIGAKVKYMVPSFDPDHPDFDAMRYWRGPNWAIVSFMVATGLKEQGLTDWSDRVTKDVRELVKMSGFFEAFCPFSGRGTGGDSFSWTAAMWLYWLDDT